MEKGKIIKLFTTTLWNFNDKPLIYFETNLDDRSGKILRVARTTHHFLFEGKIFRHYNPVLSLLNNQTAKILQFKRKEVEDDNDGNKDRGKNNPVGNGPPTN